MFTICFSQLRDGEMVTNEYSYYYFRTTMRVVADLIRDYNLMPTKTGDCWTITVFYKKTTILTLNSAMF